MPTKIGRVRNVDGTQGETWNLVAGCTKTSPGCAHCYAEAFAQRPAMAGSAQGAAAGT